MKKLLLILALCLLAFSAQAFTNSIDLELGSSQYLSHATVAFPTPDITCEGWFNFESVNAGNTGLCSTSGQVGSRSWLWFFAGPPDNLMVFFTYGGGFEPEDTAFTPTEDTWYHLAVTFNDAGNEVKFYVNGVQQGTTDGNSGALATDTDTLYIGAYNAGQFFDGEISNVKLWNTVRTEAEIATDMCATLGATTGLLGEWSLDNVLTDNSGSGYTLTNNNSASFAAVVPDCAAGFTPTPDTTEVQVLES